MYVEDCAKVICKILFSKRYYPIINIGTRNEVTIKYLAEKISKIIGFKGKIKFDTKKPNGTMRKLLDISKIKNLKNISFTDFETGLKITYKDFIRRFY
jgi:GDP-L-fucose synthase